MNPNKTQIPENNHNAVGRLNKTAYRDGYIHGQVDEHNIQQGNRIIRENNSAAGGLLTGITLTAIAFFVGGVLFFITQTNQPAKTNIETAPVPQTNQPQNP
ncbi:hypothetical protein [Allocoleopsis franciscana]|uniref:Uncharacterized protein n=1 Tax=Allocoleopsis franciscana PCC 7113 TaxID=1173027 RepID=K9WPH1_9CYAN|nr:hypothetical protein [Allocoleopsis franciscana]AFZ21706.1 hypothetical protein Mic7113_6112 [Allocoleopsis franciscana PCC 7113]